MLRLSAVRLLLLSFFLLSAQISVAVHATEHPFHHHVASCDTFLAASHDQGLCATDFTVAVTPQKIEPASEPIYSFRVVPSCAYCARAPPAAI